MGAIRARTVVLLTSILMLVASCSDDDATSTTDTAPSTDGTTAPAPNALRSVMEDAGISVVNEPAPDPVTSIELLRWQVDNMARELEAGDGYLGTELDALAGAPGGLPFSYLVAGWLVSTPTDTAAAAAELMGDQPWRQAPSIVFPTAVLTLFVADAIDARMRPAPLESGLAVDAISRQGGVCSALAGWFNDVLDFVFESLKVEVEDPGFLGWLGAIWNAALDLARGAIEGVIETIMAPIIRPITGALGVVGTLSMVASLLKPWHVDVAPSRAETRFAVGDEPAIDEQFTVSVDTGLEIEWPATIQDCAQVAGLELPDPSQAEGSPLEWATAGTPTYGEVVTEASALDADNRATLEWVTGREESDRGEERVGTVSVAATVTARQIEELRGMLRGLVVGQDPVPPFDFLVEELFSALSKPVFDAIADLVQVRGTESVAVYFHSTDDLSAPIMGWTWVLESTHIVGLVSRGERRTLSARLILEFDETQALDEPFPRYAVTGGTITFHALGYTDDTGCTWSAPEVRFDVTPDIVPTDPDADFSPNYLYFDTTVAPIEYWGVVQSEPSVPNTVTVNCPDDDLGTRAVDYTGRNPWLPLGPSERREVTTEDIIQGERTTGTDAYSTIEWTITRQD